LAQRSGRPCSRATLERMNFAATDTRPRKSASRSRAEPSSHPSSFGFHPSSDPLSAQAPSLPDAHPRSDRFRCAGRESEFLAAVFAQKNSFEGEYSSTDTFNRLSPTVS
jgi:hypothetical protein